MATAKAKRFEFAASVDRAGRISAEGHEPAGLGEEWTPEHLVLAALARCSLASLGYHARRAGLDWTGSGSASGVVTRNDPSERYAFTEVEARLDVEIDPEPTGDGLRALLAKAERDCFVSASLVLKTRYRWCVNGAEIE